MFNISVMVELDLFLDRLILIDARTKQNAKNMEAP